MEDGEYRADMIEFSDALIALRAALAEPQTTHWEGCEAVHPECRAKAELERKSDAIQRLWKERDELRSECRTLVRQNGEWQELNAELVEALRAASNYIDALGGDSKGYRVALAKVEASK